MALKAREAEQGAVMPRCHTTLTRCAVACHHLLVQVHHPAHVIANDRKLQHRTGKRVHVALRRQGNACSTAMVPA